MGWDRCRVLILERQAGGFLSAHRGHPGRLGNGRHGAGDGLREHGRRLGHRRRLYPEPRHRRQRLLRRVAGQRPGRGRGGRHPHPEPAQRGHQERAQRGPAVAAVGDAGGRSRARVHPESLEQHYTDMQDIEFTIQEGRLWMLQTRVGQRTGVAALNMAMDMLPEGLITTRGRC